MKAFTTRDLQRRGGSVIRHAEDGHSSVIVRRGKPLFVAVPFEKAFADQGVRVCIAVKLVEDRKLTPSQGASLGGITLEEMLRRCQATA